MAKRTPLYEEHKKVGGKMVEFAGWEMPIQYSGLTDEHKAVRNAAGIFDVSHMGEFEFKGRDAAKFLDYLTPSSASTLETGQATYSLLLTERGTIVDDIIIYRLSAEHFMMVVNASNIDKDYGWIKSHVKGELEFKNLSNEFALIALQGPKAADILSQVLKLDLAPLKTFYLKTTTSDLTGQVIIARTGYTGEDGFEIFVSPAKASALWNALLEVGRPLGLKPAGLGARDTLRLEMKYTLYGHEITEETNALEAGLRWVIKFKKPGDFIGKAALTKIRDNGVNRKLVGFKMLDKGIARQEYTIKDKGKAIGQVTSGTFSPSLEIPIGIGYVETAYGEVGTKFFVDIRGHERLAEVVETPFYKRPS